MLMTQEQTALHERFLKGITLKMLGWGFVVTVSLVSSYWAGYNGLKDSIKDGYIKTDEHITAVENRINRRTDSVQHLNDLIHRDIWNAIENRSSKSVPAARNVGFVSEYKDPKTGKITLIPEQ